MSRAHVMTGDRASTYAARVARTLDRWEGGESIPAQEIARVRAIVDGTEPDHDASGHPFGIGSRLWSSNLRPCTVLYPLDVEADAFHGRASGRLTLWWETTDGMADWSRLATYHPFTREHAPPS
jgi:hypothetical protein